MIENDDGDWRSKKCIEMLKIRAISSSLESEIRVLVSLAQE